MARQHRELPTRKLGDERSKDDESLLLRSAESLGRVIGALQRQLDGATKRLSYADGDGAASTVKAPARTRIVRKSASTTRRAAAAKRTSTAAGTKRKSAKKR
jgi:hypothetical protein